MGNILAGINEPQDIRQLDIPSLSLLAQDIRELIITTVARTGGHLASSLGAVELTLALHYVFDTPRDKIVWDVGHQAYAHKIITGRREAFSTLRQQGGISGFPKREESIYDVFNVGHSSTSISAATGMAEARRLKGENHKIVVVIGDGSMSAGMALEGLNWAGDRKEDLIIILNDNEMSISPNVGALSSYLNRIMTGETVTRLRADLKTFLSSIPSIGGHMLKFSRQFEEALKSFLLPGALFEDLGFIYVGPLQGHRLDRLIKNLHNIRQMKGPILVHVLTKKGKGYQHAEEKPLRFHGTSSFCIETGRPTGGGNGSAPITYTGMFGETLVRLGRENSRIVAITAAMCNGTGLDEFSRAYPDRFFDVGIAEQHSVTFAAGLAVEGLIPVVAIYSTFLQRAYDQIIHDVCLQNLHVVFCLDRGGFVGDDGATHHGVFDLSYLRSIPNMMVMAPKDENELQHMLKTAVDAGGPVAVRYPRGNGQGVSLDYEPHLLPIGRGEILREGDELAVIAIGATVYPALAAAEELRKEGIAIRVINARFVKPMDRELIRETAGKLKKLITVEENVRMGGFGSAVMELLAVEEMSDVRIRILGIPDVFVEHATQQELRRQAGIDRNHILAAARELISESGQRATVAC